MEYDNHKSLSEYVSYSNNILQPTYEEIIELGFFSAKILKTKKLFLEEVTNEDVLNMYCKLRDDGYLWYDTKPENIGKDENGNMYLIDYGELIYINDLAQKRQREIQNHENIKSELSKYYYKNKNENYLGNKVIQDCKVVSYIKKRIKNH